MAGPGPKVIGTYYSLIWLCYSLQACLLLYQVKVKRQQVQASHFVTQENEDCPFLNCGVDYAGPFTVLVFDIGTGRRRIRISISTGRGFPSGVGSTGREWDWGGYCQDFKPQTVWAIHKQIHWPPTQRYYWSLPCLHIATILLHIILTNTTQMKIAEFKLQDFFTFWMWLNCWNGTHIVVS